MLRNRAQESQSGMQAEIIIVLLILIAMVGWVLGIMGFFSARRALWEVAALRDHVAQMPVVRASVWAEAPSVPAEAPEPAAEPLMVEPESAPLPRKSADLETILATRWGIWLGAAALLMAGVFLIRYAVEQDLLGPAIRCVLAALLGCALIGGAEWLRRRPSPFAIAADEAPPALAAGGVAVLFGAAYGAGVLYALVPPLAGFGLLAAASLAGLALSLRHGQLVAAVGIVGALVTPALVQTDNPSLPGLFLYLLFVTAAALAVVRYTAWIWLGWATTAAGAGWVLAAVLMPASPEVWAPALFVPLSATVNLLLLPPAALDHPLGRRLAWVPCAALGAAGLLLACTFTGWETRAGVLLLAPLTIWKAAKEPRLRFLPFLAALLFLLLLASWSLTITDWPDIAMPQHHWTPAVVQALFATAALTAGLFAASGVRMQQSAAQPLAWAALTAAVPVLALGVCYARVARFEARPDWAVVAFTLAGLSTGLAALAMRMQRTESRQLAGAHAAGAVAALALGSAMLLTDQWLSLAVSLLLPGLAWVEAKADLRPLRPVALAVAVLVMIRLLANWYVLDYAFGAMPVLNGLLPAYGVPAAAFAVAAWLFRRRGDDTTVGVLEAGAAAFATVLVAMEIRQGSGAVAAPVLRFSEAALHVGSLSVMAYATLRIATRMDRPVLGYAWRLQGGLALAGGVILLMNNPVLSGAEVGSPPLADWLLPAYLLPAAIALAAVRHPGTGAPPWLRWLLASYALIAGFAWITLEVRHLFHGARIGLGIQVQAAELWAWSGAWLAYGAVLLIVGLRRGVRALRLAAVAIVGLTAAKVFVIDMGGLEGLWRVLSFLGLGLTLIGLGAVYRRLAAPAPQET